MDLKVMGGMALAIIILGSLFVFFSNQEPTERPSGAPPASQAAF